MLNDGGKVILPSCLLMKTSLDHGQKLRDVLDVAFGFDLSAFREQLLGLRPLAKLVLRPSCSTVGLVVEVPHTVCILNIWTRDGCDCITCGCVVATQLEIGEGTVSKQVQLELCLAIFCRLQTFGVVAYGLMIAGGGVELEVCIPLRLPLLCGLVIDREIRQLRRSRQVRRALRKLDDVAGMINPNGPTVLVLFNSVVGLLDCNERAFRKHSGAQSALTMVEGEIIGLSIFILDEGKNATALELQLCDDLNDKKIAAVVSFEKEVLEVDLKLSDEIR